MKTFDVYHHPVNGYQAVKQGFAWPAFFFGPLWAFVKKMWVFGLVVIGIFIVMAIIEVGLAEVLTQHAMNLISLGSSIGIAYVFGKEGNDWRRKHLLKRGFEKKGEAQSKTPDAAIADVAR